MQNIIKTFRSFVKTIYADASLRRRKLLAETEKLERENRIAARELAVPQKLGISGPGQRHYIARRSFKNARSRPFFKFSFPSFPTKLF
jgi:hypothetical protein